MSTRRIQNKGNQPTRFVDVHFFCVNSFSKKSILHSGLNTSKNNSKREFHACCLPENIDKIFLTTIFKMALFKLWLFKLILRPLPPFLYLILARNLELTIKTRTYSRRDVRIYILDSKFWENIRRDSQILIANFQIAPFLKLWLKQKWWKTKNALKTGHPRYKL